MASRAPARNSRRLQAATAMMTPPPTDPEGAGPANLRLPLDFSRPLPSYAQLEQALRDAIIARRLEPGCRLPEERELARQFKVSRGTVRRALSALETTGLLIRQQGRGTYVAEPDSLPAMPLAVILEGDASRVHKGYHGDLFQALLETAAAMGVELLLRESPTQRGAMEPSGYIFLNPRNPAEVRRLALTGAPVIAVDCLVKGPGVDSIQFDNVRAGYEATRALIAAGHRRIGWIEPQLAPQGDFIPESNAPARLAGMQQALREAKLPRETVWPLALDQVDIRRDYPAIYRRHPEVTAVMCYDETVALGLWQALQDMGLSAPKDLSLATLRLLDGAPMGGVDWTGWGTRLGDLGRVAIERAVERVQEGQRANDSLMRIPGQNEEPPLGEIFYAPHRWCPGSTLGPPSRK